MISVRIRNLACSLGALLLILALLPTQAGAAGAADATETEPPVGSYAWYWESQHSQAVTDPTSGADVATIEAPNPFCPATSAGGPPEQAGSCHPGRLPVEVQGGDYETPDKVSAVAFDLALVPFGSTITKFEATFLEAADRQSEPLNAEGKSLQACIVNEFFGDGEARQYKELPRFACEDTDPIAKRKAVQVKTKEGKEERFQYKFDLTPFAQKWIEGAPVAAILLTPVEPKEADFNAATDNNWRVVLDGPAEENGVITNVKYDAPEEEEIPPLDTGTTTDPSTTGTTGSFDSGSTSTFDSGGSDVGTGDVGSTDPAATDAATTEDPLATDLPGTENTSSTDDGVPGYMWLAILAGLFGFFMFRSVVLENSAGVRPDGVLAHIRQINAAKRGGAVEPEQAETGLASRLAPLSGGFKRIGGAASSLKSKLPFINRKG